MKATGIVRRIDDLGRVVIPKEIRRTLKIREGDSLEIYTDREGEIILKKYSPIMEMGELARQYVDALAQSSGCIVAVTDRDRIIAVSSSGKKELFQKSVSKDVERVMEERVKYEAKAGEKSSIAIAQETTPYPYEIIYPVIAQGDVIGSVMILGRSSIKEFGIVEDTLGKFLARILGSQME